MIRKNRVETFEHKTRFKSGKLRILTRYERFKSFEGIFSCSKFLPVIAGKSIQNYGLILLKYYETFLHF
jgi:hypothetical protein